MSAKRLDGSGSSDPRVFASSYFISDPEIEQFKDDVRNRPGNGGDIATRPGACTDNWTATKSVEEDKVQVFEQTGIFLLACRHGFVECIAEMKRSGELYVAFDHQLTCELIQLTARSMDSRQSTKFSISVGMIKQSDTTSVVLLARLLLLAHSARRRKRKSLGLS